MGRSSRIVFVAVVVIAVGVIAFTLVHHARASHANGSALATSTTKVDEANLPHVVFDCTAANHSGEDALVRPKSITIACADGGIGVKDLVWTSWTQSAAQGRGIVYENNCIPYCAAGTFSFTPATVTLSTPTQTTAGLFFSKMTVFYEKPGPDGRWIDHFTVPLPPQ
jgi:hypothetical protein